MSKKVRIVGDKWPPASNTYAQIDCTKTIKDILDDLASQLSVERSVLENESVYCRAIDGGKMGPPIKIDEPLEMVAAKPILFIRKKGPPPAAGASPVAKPGVKVMAKPGAVKTVPPPPPGAKTSTSATSSPTAGSSTNPPPPTAKSPMKKMIAGKTMVKIPPKPTAKVPAASTADSDNDDSNNNNNNAEEAHGKGDDDFDPTSGGASKFGGGLIKPNNNKNDNSDDDGKNNNNNHNDKDSDADESRSESQQHGTEKHLHEPTPDDSRSSSSVPAPPAKSSSSVPPPPVAKPTAPVAESSGKKVFAKKAVAPAAPESSAATNDTPPAPTATTTTTTAPVAILATHGSSAGMDNVAAALAAQRSVDDRLLQLQKSLVDEEKKRIEQYEINLRHALAAEVDSIKTSLNASMQEERARSMQVQAVLEEQRTQLLRALAERDTQLQLAQGALQEAVQLGGKQAGPALAAINNNNNNSSSSAVGSNAELAKEMQSQNDQLKKLLAAKDSDAKAAKNANRAELDAMIKAQSQLVRSIDQIHNATSNVPSSVIEEQKKDLATFLATVGLSRFTEHLTKNDIDLEILFSLNDDELAKAGIDTVGARKRILLESMKSKKSQQAQAQFQQQFSVSSFSNQQQQQQASRELFATSGAGGGSPMSPMNKKSVSFGQNTNVPPPPPPPPSSPSGGSSSSPHLIAARQQAQQDAQQASIQASQLSPLLQDHHRVLHQLFRRAGAADWLTRSAEMVESFKDSLPALYEAVSSKLGVPAGNYQQGTGASALRQFVARRFPHLIPAIDVMVFLADGREAEFADTMMLRQLKIGPQRLVWFCVPVAPEKAPEFAEDTSDGREKLYFYSALSKMSQWKRPTLFPEDKPVPKVQLVGKPLDDAIPKQGESLSPNPPANHIAAHRATDQQFIAATLSLLMRRDASRLSQFPEFCRAYERKIDGEEAGKINYKGMYLDALQSYGPDDD